MSFMSDLSSGAVGGLLGGIGTLAKDIRQAITGELSAEKQAEIIQKTQELELQAMQAQTAINVEEAKNENLFVSGWRPFVGWVCGLSLAYASIINPLMCWVAKVSGYKGDFPILDTTITMQVLLAILGVGVMRSFDKLQSPSPKGKE